MSVICIDVGNTFTKIAVFENDDMKNVVTFSSGSPEKMLQHFSSLPRFSAGIMSVVGNVDGDIANVLSSKVDFYIELTAQTPLPIKNLYKTPETLGKDRLAAVIGAYCQYPGKNILVVDAGTALTFDFIDKTGNYHGGNISPGINIRFRALHDYTQRLPLEERTADFPMFGNSTKTAIIAGVQNGIIFEVSSYINHLKRKYGEMVFIFSGGDAIFFADKMETPIFVESNLVLIGLNEIVKYNLRRE
ncbi:MAG: type III pantothenate kinase [Bacteroidales bacterium]|nr:type III pantothenate kinase [Bacteroidales bacterium]